MLLSWSWTQAGINILKTDPRAIRVLQFSRDEGGITEEEQALAQAGKKLLENTMHQIDEVETCTGTTIQWYGLLKGVDIDTNRMIGLTNMEFYTRLIDYVQKNGGFVPKVSQQGGSCLFHSIQKSIACPREFSNSYLCHMIVCFIMDNFELLWPMLSVAIKGNYGHLGLTPEEFTEKESQDTLTDKEREEYFEPGPFSVVAYLENLLHPGFYGEEICLLVISMMWKICITVINWQTLMPVKIRHQNTSMKVDVVLVHCNNVHFIPLHKFFFPRSMYKCHTFNCSVFCCNQYVQCCDQSQCCCNQSILCHDH